MKSIVDVIKEAHSNSMNRMERLASTARNKVEAADEGLWESISYSRKAKYSEAMDDQSAAKEYEALAAKAKAGAFIKTLYDIYMRE